MQFVTDGPDIPDELLQSHEEGRVVFFCGAGISYPAGLPDFRGLVDKIYEINGEERSAIEQDAYKGWQFDATLDLFERRLDGQRRDGQRMAVRNALAQALKPNLRKKGAIDTQAALLRLARNREGMLRLVTTNFDRLFHVAAKRTGQSFKTYSAPMLPIPKSSRWDGLVYLHGLLPEQNNDTALNRLIVTSGDFGLAYLVERWAARFVGELFRNYVVCFVGYSINDPVLRYMMDALAADRMLGEVTPKAWAFGDCEPGNEVKKKVEWEAKGTNPILYQRPAGTLDHSALHRTLHAWAETYRDGVQGKEAIVVKHALARPQDSTQSDNFVDRMLWALSDKSGLPARRFAEHNPVPSLDWLLECFAVERFGHTDLSRFDIPPRDAPDSKLRFSLVRRPAPYDRAPLMLLASGSTPGCDWDDLMRCIARWLIRHLNDARLLIWIAERGGQMQEPWPFMIEQELDRIAALELAGKTSELDDIRTHAPMAIPSPLMRILWRLLLSRRVKTRQHDIDLYRWKLRLKREGLTTTIRLQLRELLSPQVSVKKLFRWAEDHLSAEQKTRIGQIVDAELVLAADDVHSTLCDCNDGEWLEALPLLFDDLQRVLLDTLDLAREMGEADDREDGSYWHLPSISKHWQNRGFKDWVSLIELLRDSWLSIRSNEPSRATRFAQSWFELPYPTFKRLALFAASQDDCISPEIWVNWLVTDDAWWLWSACTGREVYRLLVLQGQNLRGEAQSRLEEAIMAGPPREMFKEDLLPERWQEVVDHYLWLRLAKLDSSGHKLGTKAASRLKDLTFANPAWKLATNERDEFSHWMSGTGDPDFEESREIDTAPRKRQELASWLAEPAPDRRPFYQDTWREVCRTRFFLSLSALSDLARKGNWPPSRWREALQTWSEEGMVLRSWKFAANVVRNMPTNTVLEIVHAYTWWIETASKSIDNREGVLLEMCARVLELPLDPDQGSHILRNGVRIVNPVGSAINHPIGLVTQALINRWFKRAPNDNDLLPVDLKPSFSALCDLKNKSFRHGRVLLGSQLIAFFRVDRAWTEQYLLPLFDWKNDPDEAKGVWEGFLWSPRLYPPLLSALKTQLLDSAGHYEELGEHHQQFAAFLTYAALDPTDGYTVDDFRSAIARLPQSGLEESAQALAQAVESAGDQREDYWKNRAQPFLKLIWPKSRNLTTPRISDCLARTSIAARGEFPAALATVLNLLCPVDHPDQLLRRLCDSGLCNRYPDEALTLLNAVIVDQRWLPRELNTCLDQIIHAAPTLVNDWRYTKLRELARRRTL